ncbi:MAG: transcriptional regulator [Caulobacter sp.]|nr:transcriptional regulator [Caulobacter sp.]
MANLRQPERIQAIGEICREYAVTSRAVRFYEEMGLLEPRRQGTVRLFGNRERARLRLILAGKRMRLSIRDIADIFALRDEGDGNAIQSRAALDIFRRQLNVLARQREDLDEAVEVLQQSCEALEEQLRHAPAEVDAAAPRRRPGEPASAGAR